jgi:hypothetical protein
MEGDFADSFRARSDAPIGGSAAALPNHGSTLHHRSFPANSDRPPADSAAAVRAPEPRWRTGRARARAAKAAAYSGVELGPELRHDPAALRLGVRMLNHAKQSGRKLTLICGAFLLRNDPNAAPGATFSAVRRRRPGEALILPRAAEERAAIAVETVSPYARHAEVADRVVELFDAGVCEVWQVDPARRSVAVHAPGRSVQTLSGDDELACESLLPGFVVRVDAVFEG